MRLNIRFARSLLLLMMACSFLPMQSNAKIRNQKSVANPLDNLDCVAALSLNRIPLVRADGFPAFEQMPIGRMEKLLEKAIIQSRLTIRGLHRAADLPATFDSVIVPIDDILRTMAFFEDAIGIFTNSYITREAKKVEAIVTPMRTGFLAELFSDPKLYRLVQAVDDNSEVKTVEQSRLIKKYLQSFRLKGAHLPAEQRQQVQNLAREISLLGTQYKNNMTRFSAENKIHVETEEELRGVSKDFIAAFAETAKREGKTGFLIPLNFGSYGEIMLNSENADLQKRVWEVFARRSYLSGETDNSKLIPRIVEKRQKLAELIGYKTHADAILSTRMAGSLESVEEFHQNMLKAFRPLAEKEAAQLRAFVKAKTGSDHVDPWRFPYWSRQQEKELFKLDKKLFREYLPEDVVLKGLFETIRQQTGFQFIERTDLPKPGQEAQVYEVRDRDNNLVGYTIMDLFARDTKRDGAWMAQILTPILKNGERLPSVVTVNLNLTKPKPGEPLLFQLGEAVTLYHEFGHALHGLSSKTKYHGTAGTNVKWDFVELPSQMFEAFFSQPENLRKYTRHFKTNQPVPEEMIQALINAEKYQKGITILRQLSLQRIDLAWHSNDPRTRLPLLQFEEEALAPYRVFPRPDFASVTSTSFHHIFSALDDYSAGYYSYMWADVLVANVILRFKEEGFFNPVVAEAFQTFVREVGDSVDPEEAMANFLGHKAVVEAILKLYGATP